MLLKYHYKMRRGYLLSCLSLSPIESHLSPIIATELSYSYMALYAVIRLDVGVPILFPHSYYSTMHCPILIVLTTCLLLFPGSQCHTLLAKGKDHPAPFSLRGCIGIVSAFIPPTYIFIPSTYTSTYIHCI